jgi:hypothetical protein
MQFLPAGRVGQTSGPERRDLVRGYKMIVNSLLASGKRHRDKANEIEEEKNNYSARKPS